MRRLLQLGTLMLLVAALSPFEEVFDQWDAPGLANDTEFAVFTIVFAISLVLLVCQLIVTAILRFGTTSARVYQSGEKQRTDKSGHTFIFVVPPLTIVPLRL